MVHATIDNWAGKSTLMKILCDVHEPTNGAIYYDGPVEFKNPKQARRLGIETVYQDLALMNDLDVAADIFMGQFPTRGIGPYKRIDWRKTYERAEEIIQNRLRRSIDAYAKVEFLPSGQRQLVAIARALAFDPEVIILDEPTSALSIDATELVHDTVRTLQSEGHTIIVISHNVEDIIDIADRIGILYQGQFVSVVNADDATPDTLQKLLVTGQH